MNRLAESDGSRSAAPDAALRERPASAAGPAENIYMPRRRLGALEAAAATAVIVASVVALASMTGLLPAAMHFSAGPDTPALGAASAADTRTPPTSTATASTTSGAVSRPAMADPAGAGAGTAATAGTPATPVSTTIVIAPTSSIPSVTTPDVALPSATAAPAGTPAPVPAMESSALAAAVPGRPHRSRSRAARNGSADHGSTMHAGRAGNGYSKTREQVIAELMQAKRDGTYHAQSETYR